jgi:hypothetical protein
MLYYFYYPEFAKLDIENHRYQTGLDHWVLDTYRKLKDAYPNYEIQIGDKIPDEGIVFFHRNFFDFDLQPSNNQFFVCFQVDRGRHPFAHFHIVHNKSQTNAFYFPLNNERHLFSFTRSIFIHPWPINLLQKKVSVGRNSITRLSFHGNIINLPTELQSDAFRSYLKERGLQFTIYDSPDNWNDFTSTDLSICVRRFSKSKFYAKPFIKLTNSLLAGIPVIAGPESSSLYFKDNIIDIPIVHTYNDLLLLIDRIVSKEYDPYVQIDDFQKQKYKFESNTIIKQWGGLLADITESYNRWRKAGTLNRASFFYCRKMIQMIQRS